jgi:hypothetical protein
MAGESRSVETLLLASSSNTRSGSGWQCGLTEQSELGLNNSGLWRIDSAVSTRAPYAASGPARSAHQSLATYVGRVGSATASASRTTISVPVGGSGVVAGHTLVVSLLLSSTTHLTTAATATDSAGNSYVVGRDTNDGSSGDRTVMLVSVTVRTNLLQT